MKSIHLQVQKKPFAVASALVAGLLLPLLIAFEGHSSPIVYPVDLFFLIYGFWHIKFYLPQVYLERRVIPKELSLIALSLASLPLASIALSFGFTEDTLLLLPKLFFLKDIEEIKKSLDRRDHISPLVSRLVPLFFIVPLVIHIVSCGWVYLGSGSIGTDPNPWVAYVKAGYWTVTTLSTVGYGDITPTSVPQMLFANVVMILGLMFFGYVLGNVASLLARLDAAKEEFYTHMDRVETFMSYNSLPSPMRQKIRAYFRYAWESGRGFDNEGILGRLPIGVRTEVSMVLHKDIVEKVPFLKDASRELLETIVLNLEARVVMPEEYIFRVGDPGDGMYFIRKGEVEILTPQNERLAVLSSGSFFGEGALLSDRSQRSASARAIGFTDLLSLSSECFQKILDEHPEFANHMHEVSEKRSNSNRK
ncbi:cyclic nucleotide-binding domain-containing protein [bacterium]|nr:cyclic nucleotide-binding domain-containing protein [bacterium]